MVLPCPLEAAYSLLRQTDQCCAPIELQPIIDLWPEINVSADTLERDGYIYDAGQLGVEIVVKAGERINRRRYTVAHELGHWYLKILTGLQINSFHGTQEVERWCDRFAAHLLIPQYLIADLTSWENLSIEKIMARAYHLKVSGRTLLWRVLEETPYSGGAMRFCFMGKPNSPADLKLRLDWCIFPKEEGQFVAKYAAVPLTSPIYEALSKTYEQVVPNVKLSYGSLRGARTLILKSFRRSVLSIVLPEEVDISSLSIGEVSLSLTED
jgi:hypothetical protein